MWNVVKRKLFRKKSDSKKRVRFMEEYEDIDKIQQERNLLMQCNMKNTPRFNFDGKVCLAKCISVYDGDTATFVFQPFSESEFFKISCRFYGINCAEIRTKDEEEKKKGLIVKQKISDMILNQIVELRFHNFDKYGRPMVDIYILDQNKTHLNRYMLDHDMAKPYDGKGAKLW